MTHPSKTSRRAGSGSRPPWVRRPSGRIGTSPCRHKRAPCDGGPDQELLDYVAICRLQAAYADAVTRRAWSDLEALFLPDAPVTVDTVTSDPFEFVGCGRDRWVHRRRGRAVRVLRARDPQRPRAQRRRRRRRARSRSFTCELRQERANGHWTNAFGVYHDELQRVDGRWRYARRRYQSIARTGRGEVFPFPQPPGFG